MTQTKLQSQSPRLNRAFQVSTLLRNDGIVETVQAFEKDADLIVIGKRGQNTESDESHLGSNFERVVRASHKPIMVASRQFNPINCCFGE